MDRYNVGSRTKLVMFLYRNNDVAKAAKAKRGNKDYTPFWGGLPVESQGNGMEGETLFSPGREQHIVLRRRAFSWGDFGPELDTGGTNASWRFDSEE